LRETDFSDQQGLPLFPWLGVSIEALEQQKAVLLLGSNIRKDQPLLSHRLRKASLKGAAIMVINPMDFGMSFDVAINGIVKPSEMVAALAAVAATILQAKKVAIPEALQSVIAAAAKDDIYDGMAEKLLASDESLLLLGELALTHPDAALLRALGGVIAENSDIKLGFLPQGANAAGAWLAGAVPHRLPAGKQNVQAGMNTVDMLLQPRKAYLLWNVEPEYDCGNPGETLHVLSQAEFVAVATAFVNDTMKHYADVLLPIAASFETSGTFVNTEGRWQSVRAAVMAPGEVRPGWKLLRVLGNLADLPGFDYLDSESVRDELKQQLSSLAHFNNHIELQSQYRTGISLDPGKLQRFSSVNAYRSDALVRRATALQMTADGKQNGAYLNSRELAKLRLQDAGEVRVEQNGRDTVMPLHVHEGVADGCVWIPDATESSAELTGSYGSVEVTRS
jgi:NADH-quinone oxidoreductase subunit G